MRVLVSTLFSFLISFHSTAYDLEYCKTWGAQGTTMPFTNSGEFIPQCAPDTLFSWQDSDDVYHWAENSSKDNLLPLKKDKATFFWRTPAGTYAYGDISVRVKLKPDVQFKKIYRDERNCEILNRINGEDKKIVYVALLPSLGISEYILCNDNAVDSWSYGTEHNLREIKAEINYVECIDGDFSRIDRYSNPDPTDLSEKEKKAKFGFSVDSGILSIFGLADSWTDKTLRDHIQNIEEIIDAGGGHIFQSKEAIKAGRDHFETKSGYYFPFDPSNSDNSN